MPEHLRALVVILAVATTVFALAKQPVSAIIESEAAYKRDRNLWFAVVLIAFLSHSFWLCAIITSIVIYRAGKKHDSPLALYFLLVFAVLPLSMQIPGVGPIDHIITVNHYRILHLTLLLPFALRLYEARSQRARVPRMLDFLVASYLLWTLSIQAQSDVVTATVRSGFYMLVDSWLPYYVASRCIKGIADFRRVAAAIVTACCIVAILAVLESGRHWLLYDGLRSALGVPRGRFSMYLARGSGGPIRALVTLGHAIVLGYVLIPSVAMALFLYRQLQPKWKRNALIATLIAGLIGSLSRGPWVGCAAMFLTVFALGPGLSKRLMHLIFGGGTALTLLLISPLGDTVISYLPFVGTVETKNVDYRAQLLEVSLAVYRQNPIVGDYNYLLNPLMEEMRQGQGIIDVVNTYVQVLLPFGAVGLTLYVGCFICAFLNVNRVRKQAINDPELELLGRVLMGTLIGLLVTIGTVSSIGFVPTMLWFLAGLGGSYARLFSKDRKARSMRREVSVPAGVAQVPPMRSANRR